MGAESHGSELSSLGKRGSGDAAGARPGAKAFTGFGSCTKTSNAIAKCIPCEFVPRRVGGGQLSAVEAQLPRDLFAACPGIA